MDTHTQEPELTIRLAAGDACDDASIRRLADLDREEPPDGPALLAELDGEPVAAIGFDDGHTVADRRRASSSLLTLLHLRRLETRAIAFVFGA
ncbi:MAG TPA: hypothetical protein VH817_08105 [Thermoleophilaceae bacterium]|jgi:hypothetical protein